MQEDNNLLYQQIGDLYQEFGELKESEIAELLKLTKGSNQFTLSTMIAIRVWLKLKRSTG